jgi:hypothetical protein
MPTSVALRLEILDGIGDIDRLEDEPGDVEEDRRHQDRPEQIVAGDETRALLEVMQQVAPRAGRRLVLRQAG